MNTPLIEELKTKFDLSAVEVARLGHLGIVDEGDFAFIKESDLVGIEIPVVTARKILAFYANKPPVVDYPKLFADLLKAKSDHSELMKFLIESGKPFTNETFWLDSANDLSLLTIPDLLIIRTVIGPESFTPSVCLRLMTDRDEQEKKAILLLPKIGSEVVAGLRQMSGFNPDFEPLLAELTPYLIIGFITRALWKISK